MTEITVPPITAGVVLDHPDSGNLADLMPPAPSAPGPSFDPALLSAAEMAVIEMVRFDAANPELKELMTLAEAASSCSLDGIRASTRDIVLATLVPPTSGSAAGQVMAAALAVTRSGRGHPMLSVRGIGEIHRAVTGEDAGTQAPGLDELIEFMGRADMPVLAHTALAHARFCALQPFHSGNGRTARALTLAMLRAAGVTSASVIPLSAGLAGNPRGYTSTLNAYRLGDTSAIVELFTEAAFIALDNSLMLASRIRKIGLEHSSLLGQTRSTAALGIMAELARTPALTAASAMAVAGVSESAAYRALDQLSSAGILEPAGKVRGTLAWTAPRVVTALDDFLVRVGR